MASTSLDLSQIRTDALSSGATFRTLIGLGSSDSPTYKGIVLATGTITSDTPALNITQTWNNNAVAFTGMKFNVTDTASSATSLLADWQIGGVSRMGLRKDGKLLVTSVQTGNIIRDPTGNLYIGDTGGVTVITGSVVSLTAPYGFNVSMGTMTTNQPFSVAQTWNAAGTTFTGILSNITDTASSASSLLMDLQVGGTSRLKVDKAGNIRAPSLLFGTTSTSFGITNDGFSINLDTNYQDVVFRYVGTEMYRVALNEIGMPASAKLFWTDRQTGSGGWKDTVLVRDAAGTLAQRNGANQQRFNLYGTWDTNGTNYRRLYLDSTTAGAFTIGVEGAGTGASGNTLSIANTPAFPKGLTVNGSSGDWNCYIAPTLWAGANTGPSGAYLCNWTVSYGRTSAGIASIDSDLGLQVKNFARTADAPVTASALSLTDTWNSNVSVTGASGNGTTATLTFSAMTTAFAVGSTIVVSSVNPSGYNGTFTVTASSTTSVSYLNATTGAYVSGGNIKQLFTALKLNVTDTSSDAGSLLLSLQKSGSNRLTIDKNGLAQIQFDTTVYNTGLMVKGTDGVTYGTVGFSGYSGWNSMVQLIVNGGTTGTVNIGAGQMHLTHSAGNTSEIRTYGNLVLSPGYLGGGGTVVEQRNSTNAQTFRLYRTASGSPGTDYERLALSSTTYSSAVYQTILCESGGTGAANINLVIGPKGTGAILAQVPDGTATGGNARGQYAVDLQLRRDSNTSVASGAQSVVLGGHNNSATGSWSGALCGKDNLSSGLVSVVCGGEQNTSGASYAGIVTGSSNALYSSYTFIGGGFGNYIAGPGSGLTSDYGAILGGRQNRVYAQYGVVIGGYQGLADRLGQVVVGGGPFATLGDAQDSKFVLRIKTANATPSTLLLCDGSTRLTIPSGKVFAFVAKISGIKSDGSAVAFYTRKGAIKNVGGTTSLVGSIETIGTDTEDNASTDVAITADDTNDALQINVTGIAAETWRWVAVVEGVEIGYGT